MRGAAFLGECVQSGGRRHNDEPGAGLHLLSRLANSGQSLGEGGRPDPVHFGAEGLGGANAVDVVVDQAGDHGAALKIDHARLRTGQLFDFGTRAQGHDFAVADGQRLTRGKLGINGEDFALQQDGIRILRPGRQGQHESGEDQRGGIKQPHEICHA